MHQPATSDCSSLASIQSRRHHIYLALLGAVNPFAAQQVRTRMYEYNIQNSIIDWEYGRFVKTRHAARVVHTLTSDTTYRQPAHTSTPPPEFLGLHFQRARVSGVYERAAWTKGCTPVYN